MNKLISLLLLLAAGANVLAAEAPSADILTGCTACHGAVGEGNKALGAPPLAGQDTGYLARQLHNFRAGRRGYAKEDKAGQLMRASAGGLSDENIASLSVYFSGLPAVRLPAVAQVSPEGAARYQATCAYCHGEQAQGYPQMQAPNLRILGGWYIDQQLTSYRQGWRGSELHGDIQGMWMRSIATHISDPDEQQAVVSFIESLGD